MLYGIGPDDDREKTGCILRRHRQRARVGRYGFKDLDGTEHPGKLADGADRGKWWKDVLPGLSS